METKQPSRCVYVGIPVYNAEATISEVLGGVISSGSVDKVIVVLDGCKDSSEAKVNAFPGVIVVKHEKNRGYGSAQKSIFHAFKAHSANADDLLVMVHADGQTPADEIRDFVAAFDRHPGCHVVVGSRVLGAAKSGFRRALWRRFGDRCLTAFGNFFLGSRFSTFASGFRAFRREAFEILNPAKLTDSHFIDVEVLAEVQSQGLRYVEIPVGIYPDLTKSGNRGLTAWRQEFSEFFYYASEYSFLFAKFVLTFRFRKTVNRF